MSFQSIDELITSLSAERNVRFDWVKTSSPGATVAGRWYNTSGWNGTPRVNAFSGTSLTWTTCNESTGNGTHAFGIPHGGNVSANTKHILNASVIAPTVPSQLMLVDLQGYWPGISTNSPSIQTLSGTPSLRYTDGKGCRLFFVQTVASGATSFNMSLSYTNSGGTTGRSLPATVGMNGSAIASTITHSGTGSLNYGPFLPLANNDNGVQNVASVTMSAASGAGTGALCLARPLFTLPVVTTGMASERDLLNQFPSLPRVYDEACLVWLIYTGASMAQNLSMYGRIDFAWG